MAGEQSPDDKQRPDKMQPGGSINPKVLLAIAAILVIATIVILIIVFTKTGDVPQEGSLAALHELYKGRVGL